MNRVQEIILVESAYRSPYVMVRDEIDVQNNFSGRQYRPSYGVLEMVRRIARKMVVDMDFQAGRIVLRRPTVLAADETHCACKDEAFINDETPGCCGNCGKPFRH